MHPTLNSFISKNRLLSYIARQIRYLRLKFRNPIQGRNNIIHNKGHLANVRYDISGNNNYLQIREGAVVSDILIFIRGDNHVLEIGKNYVLKGGSMWFEDHNCTIRIGDYTTVESAHFAATEPDKSIIVGKDCMFSNGIELRTGDSHSIVDANTQRRINPAKNIEIGDHVWLGANSTILKGVHIGNNSIISTGALVTKDVPDHSIAAGVPAQIVKNDVDWLRERIYGQ